ncbi:PAS domain S-box protein [Methanolobus vulcani]|uniref:histidine kinase n=1 Tax=Methanolobus vulcani TaxID=38026 RepID=A0A7Z8P4T9_9EURY|nr:PAS domain S-box protein [Methanolobus vulcani]TQD25655.1 PAS domain S-box protein [Methanolobus vulcani]
MIKGDKRTDVDINFIKIKIFIILYVLLAGLWILFSNSLLKVFAFDRETCTMLGTYKGWAFVLATGLLFYFYLKPRVEEIIRSNQALFETKEELRESERKLREAQEMAHLGYWYWDVKTGDVEWSDEVYKIFQLNPNKFVPQIDSILALSPWPEDHQRNEELIDRALKSHDPGSYEQKFLRPDNSIGYYYSTFQGKYDENGDLVLIVGTVMDITARKRAEIALSNNVGQLRALLNTIPDLVWLKDVDGAYLGCNHKFERFFGAKEAEIIGKTDYDFVDKELADFFRKKDIEALEAEKPSMNEEEITYADDGHKEYLETIKSPMYDSGGQLIGVLGVGRDITERKEAEVKIKNKKEKLFQIINGNPTPTFVINNDHVVTHWNKAIERLTGVKTEDVIGTKREWTKTLYGFERPTLADLLVDNRVDEIKEFYAKKNFQVSFIKEGYQAEDYFPILGKWLLFTAAPIKDSDNKIVGAIETLQDITVLKQAVKAMFDAKNTAEHSSRVKSEFLASMSHELRTPLTSVIGFSDVLQDGVAGELTEKQLGYVNNINSSGKHLLALINDVLDLSKIEAGKMDLQCEKFVFSAIMNDVNESITFLVAKKNIDLKFVDEIKDIEIFADKLKTKQILLNLIDNAIKFTPPNGIISVIAKQTGKDVQISVSDTGIGIPHDKLKEIFDPFSQVDASHTRRYAGTGLGLALVKQFVQMHDGRIWVESEEGKGSTFTFTIPIEQRNA